MAEHTLNLGPSETPAIRCKTCKVPLPDATRKNCERCRRNRTESYNRWKARKNLNSLPTLETHPSSAPSSNVNIRWMNPATTSAACSQPSHQLGSHRGSGIPSSASLDHYLNEPKHDRHQAAASHLPRDAPWLTFSWPRDIDIPEYQWSQELLNALLALPPRSNFFGQFSVIADPDVDNSRRAQMFLVQLSSKGLPTLYVAAASLGFSFVEPHPRCLFSSFSPGQGYTEACLRQPGCPLQARSQFVLQMRDWVSRPVRRLCRRRHHAQPQCAWSTYRRRTFAHLEMRYLSRTLLCDETYTLCVLLCPVLELHMYADTSQSCSVHCG
jgi:hypothetical protein